MPATIDSLRHDIGQLMKCGGFNEIVDRCHLELTMARRENNRSLEIIALLGLAQGQCALGHFEYAREYALQAVDAAALIGSASLMTDALIVRARVAREGYLQTAEASDDYGRAVDIAFEAGDMRRYAQSLLGLGEIATSPDAASKHAWKAIDIARELRDAQLEAGATLLLANAFIRKQEYSKASDGLLVALRMAQSVKDRLLESVIIGQQGLVLAQNDDSYERGIQQQRAALDVARGMEAVFHEYMRLYTLAMTTLAAQDMTDARSYFDQMLALAQDIQHPPYEMYALGLLGHWHELRENADGARAAYQRAIELARMVKNPAGEARYLYALGAVHQAQWDFEGARRCYREARAIYQALDDGRNATRVRASIVYSYLLAFASGLMRLLGMGPPGQQS